MFSFFVGHYPSSGGNQDIFLDCPLHHGIERVEFRHVGELLSRPESVCDAPFIFTGRQDSRWARYSYRECSRPGSLAIQIISQSGLRAEFIYDRVGEKSNERETLILENMLPWRSRWSVRPLSNIPTFGIKLEMAETKGTSVRVIANLIQKTALVACEAVTTTQRTPATTGAWKFVHDTNYRRKSDLSSHNKFETVSPVLCGERGLTKFKTILNKLTSSSLVNISVTRSMAFHVHVSVERSSLFQLKKLCLNFVKYEEAIDSFAPLASRREYESNKAMILNPSGSVAVLNGGRHRAIEGCNTLEELCQLMNPCGSCHKLNLQNLVTVGCQRTVQFQQHYATKRVDKVLAWIRFCVIFVKKSLENSTPSYLKNSTSAADQFHDLFDNIIQCRALKKFYENRLVTATHQRTSVLYCASSRRCSQEASGGFTSSFAKLQI